MYICSVIPAPKVKALLLVLTPHRHLEVLQLLTLILRRLADLIYIYIGAPFSDSFFLRLKQMAIDDIAGNAIEVATDPGIPVKVHPRDESPSAYSARGHRPSAGELKAHKVSTINLYSLPLCLTKFFKFFRNISAPKRCVWIMPMFLAWISPAGFI